MAKRGRKPKYKKIYAKKIVDFFSKTPTEILTEKIIFKNGSEKEKKIIVATDLPTMLDFALEIKVDDQTLKNWADAKTKSGKPKYPEFFSSYYKAKKLQKNIWLKNSLAGRYNPYFASLVGKNMYGWKDKQEVDHTSKGEKIIGFNYQPPAGQLDEENNANDSANA